MGVRLRLFVGIVLLAGFCLVVWSIRKRKIDVRHSLVWILACILLAVLDLAPDLLNWITQALGFQLPVNMLFFLGFVLAIGIIFGLTARASRQSEQIRRLSQEMGMLRHELDTE